GAAQRHRHQLGAAGRQRLAHGRRRSEFARPYQQAGLELSSGDDQWAMELHRCQDSGQNQLLSSGEACARTTDPTDPHRIANENCWELAAGAALWQEPVQKPLRSLYPGVYRNEIRQVFNKVAKWQVL